jgi:uncharacterized membrane-anchored protein
LPVGLFREFIVIEAPLFTDKVKFPVVVIKKRKVSVIVEELLKLQV